MAFLAGLVTLDITFSALIDRYATLAYRQSVASKLDFNPVDPYDIWIVGDSLAVDGVAPYVITQETGRSAYDWGLYASSPFEWDVVVSDLTRHAPLPKTIVIVCHPNMFIKRPNEGPFARAAVKSPDLQAQLMTGSVQRGDLSAILGSGRRRLMLKGALATFARVQRGDVVTAAESDHGHLVHPVGLSVVPRLMFDALKFDEKNAGFQAKSFENLVRQCSEKGAEIVFAKIPVSEAQLADYESDRPTIEHYNSVLGRIAKTYRVKVYESQTPSICRTYTPPDFTDAIHLSQSGAVKFTTGLARWLRVRSP